MNRILVALMMLVGLGLAQEKKAEDTEKPVVRIVPIHYANVNHLVQLLILPGVRVSVRADADMHVLLVSGAPDAVATVEELVKKLDEPPPVTIHPNIETTAYFVSGSARTEDEVPAALAGVVKQLHALFPYKGYRVLDSCVVRGRELSRSDASGALPELGSTYKFSYRSVSVSAGTPRLLHFEDLRLEVKKPTARDKDGQPIFDYSDIGTAIDVGEGQKVVVGKSSVNGQDALILVVTAKVIE